MIRQLRSYYSIVILVILTSPVLNSCNSYEKDPTKKLIVCTTGYVADLVKSITGPEAEVISLMGPGVDPHLYKASLKDVDYLAQADLIVYSGLHLEGKMTELLQKVSKTQKIIAISDGLDKNDPITLDEKGTHDPHFWFDPILWKKGAQHFSLQYDKLKWGNHDTIEWNTQLFCYMLDDLDNRTYEKFQTLPANKRILVTPHDAFGYFCKAYGLKVKTLQGISTVAEFGIRDVTELINYLVENDIPTIFVESSISPKSIEAIVAGCKRKGHQVKIGGQLYSDALGAENSAEADYRGVFLYNVLTIYNGLKN